MQKSNNHEEKIDVVETNEQEECHPSPFNNIHQDEKTKDEDKTKNAPWYLLNKTSKKLRFSIATLMIVLIAFWRRKRQQGSIDAKQRKATASWLTHLLQRYLRLEESDKGYKSSKEASLSLLLSAAKRGLIQKALLNENACAFLLPSNNNDNNNQKSMLRWQKAIIPSNSPTIQSEILNALTEGGCEDISSLPSSWLSFLSTPALTSLPFIYLGMLYKMMKKLSNPDSSLSTSSSSKSVPSTRFTDVAGIDNAKLELEEVVSCLKNPSKYRYIGARPPRGVLLYGPSGTGKTLLARAVAGEANCVFLSTSASDFVEMLVGRGAARIRDLFDKARTEAKRKRIQQKKRRIRNGWLNSRLEDTSSSSTDLLPPACAVIFIDEIDALAKSRGGMGGGGCDEREQTLNQLLTEMDGFDCHLDDGDEDAVTVVVLAATNRPEILDSALLRPGRFDRHVFVGCPNEKGRKAILQLHGGRVKTDVDTVEWSELAKDSITNGFTGADLANVVNEAAFLAVRKNSHRVTQEHFLEGAKRVRNMKNRNHGEGYVDINIARMF